MFRSHIISSGSHLLPTPLPSIPSFHAFILQHCSPITALTYSIWPRISAPEPPPPPPAPPSEQHSLASPPRSHCHRLSPRFKQHHVCRHPRQHPHQHVPIRRQAPELVEASRARQQSRWQDRWHLSRRYHHCLNRTSGSWNVST